MSKPSQGNTKEKYNDPYFLDTQPVSHNQFITSTDIDRIEVSKLIYSDLNTLIKDLQRQIEAEKVCLHCCDGPSVLCWVERL